MAKSQTLTTPASPPIAILPLSRHFCETRGNYQYLRAMADNENQRRLNLYKRKAPVLSGA
jgi:hypothetical protein